MKKIHLPNIRKLLMLLFLKTESTNSDSYGLLAVVGINATVIGILIAIVVAVSVYYNQIVHETEFQVIQEAEKINSVFFSRSLYYSSESKSEFSRNAFEFANSLREKTNSHRVKETIKSEYDIPVSVNDINELFRYLYALSSSLHPYESQYDIGNGKYIPRDNANRGEEIMIVINYLSQADCFPETVFPGPLIFPKGYGEHVSFSGIEAVKIWLEKVNAFVLGIDKQNFFQSIESGNAQLFIDNLKTRDQQLIEKWNNSLLHSSYGSIDPNYLLRDFNAKSMQVKIIAENTKYACDKYQLVYKRYSTLSLKYLFGLLLLAFIFGVAVPLYNHNVKRWMYVIFPIGVSIFSLLISLIFL